MSPPLRGLIPFKPPLILFISLTLQHSFLSITLNQWITTIPTTTTTTSSSSLIILWTEIGKIVISILIVWWKEELKEFVNSRRREIQEEEEVSERLIQDGDEREGEEETEDWKVQNDDDDDEETLVVEMFESTPPEDLSTTNGKLHQRKQSSSNNNKKGLSINVVKAQTRGGGGTPSLSIIPPTPAPEPSPIRSTIPEVSLLFPSRPIRAVNPSREMLSRSSILKDFRDFEWWKVLRDTVFFKESNSRAIILVAVLYSLQNRAQYSAVQELNFSMFQLACQLKIPVTAMFSVILLNKSLSRLQWVSLFFLTIGVGLVQLASTSYQPQQEEDVEQYSGVVRDQFKGLILIGFSSVCSGFANCYFERILKLPSSSFISHHHHHYQTLPSSSSSSCSSSSTTTRTTIRQQAFAPSLWIRNIQLSFYGLITNIPFLLYDYYLNSSSSSGGRGGAREMGDYFLVTEDDGGGGGGLKGFFSLDPLISLLILLQIIGGLLTGLVILNLDNLIKCISTSISIIVSTFLISIFFFNNFDYLVRSPLSSPLSLLFLFCMYVTKSTEARGSRWGNKITSPGILVGTGLVFLATLTFNSNSTSISTFSNWIVSTIWRRIGSVISNNRSTVGRS
ncbi:hypothetical protein JCM3765_003628 [Sporobolomyces pararoseus]